MAIKYSEWTDADFDEMLNRLVEEAKKENRINEGLAAYLHSIDTEEDSETPTEGEGEK